MNNTGLSNEEIAKINAVFSTHANVEQALIYGSRALGTFKPWSDIDLTLIGTDITLSQLNKIEAEIDDLLLPYKVDLSSFQAIENDALTAHIERAGKLFYKKGS